MAVIKQLDEVVVNTAARKEYFWVGISAKNGLVFKKISKKNKNNPLGWRHI